MSEVRDQKDIVYFFVQCVKLLIKESLMNRHILNAPLGENLSFSFLISSKSSSSLMYANQLDYEFQQILVLLIDE